MDLLVENLSRCSGWFSKNPCLLAFLTLRKQKEERFLYGCISAKENTTFLSRVNPKIE